MAFLQLLQRDAAVEPDAEVNGDARAARQHAVDVLLEDLGRAAEGGDAPGHVAAEHVGQLVHVHGVAGFGEILRGGQPGRPAADDPDRLRLVTGTAAGR